MVYEEYLKNICQPDAIVVLHCQVVVTNHPLQARAEIVTAVPARISLATPVLNLIAHGTDGQVQLEHAMKAKTAAQSYPVVRYLPFEKFHIAPISDITPDALKLSAKDARKKYRDREDIKLTTCQNFIAKSLGFAGGFDGFQKEYLARLRPFMIKEGMTRRADLITRRYSPSIISLRPREVADRLFVSGKNLPRRIFTGYDVDWGENNCSFFGADNPWLQSSTMNNFSPQDVLNALADGRFSAKFIQPEILAAAVEAKRNYLSEWNNLLGDQLLEIESVPFTHDAAIANIYCPSDSSAEKYQSELKIYHNALGVFRLWLESIDHGWVEIIPYSDHLIFLKGRNGEYDFLFPRLRNNAFDHNPFEPFLKNRDVPKSNDAYHFRRWRYFEYQGWEALHEHEAEQAHYSGGGTRRDYPGAEECFRRFLVHARVYSPPEKDAPASAGFFPVTIDGALLFVSNLVMVGQFRQFMHQNREYALYRRNQSSQDCWESVNLEVDSFLPAAVTWYDANAYAAWVSKNENLPVRLLTEEEYLTIARPVIPDAGITSEKFYRGLYPKLCRLFLPDGTPLEGLRLPENVEFQDLLFRYDPEVIQWEKAQNGLTFLVSPDFGEWLNHEGAAVNTGTLSSLCDPEITPRRYPFAAESTGKYKFKKVGFRLCYFGKQ